MRKEFSKRGIAMAAAITMLMLCQLGMLAADTFHLKVRLAKDDDASSYDVIMAIQQDGKMAAKRDTCAVLDGIAEYSISLDSPCQGILRQKGKDRPRGYRFIAVPGEECVITADEKSASYHFSGTAFYQEYDRTDRFMEDLDKKYEARMKDATQQERAELAKAYGQECESYVREHGDEEGTILAASTLGTEKYASLISQKTRNGRMKSLIDSMISQEQEQEEQERKEAEIIRSMEGKPAPEISLMDINGKQLALSSLRGKYVVLDFWGSWCIWCIRGIPKMKEYYSKYSGKVEILGIDCQDTDEKWRKAVKDHELPWLHVYNPRGSSVLKDYNVRGFPTKAVVGPDGTLLKIIVGEDPEFYTYLDSILGN